MAEFPSIPLSPYEQDPNSVNRVGKRQILPNTIESRHLDTNLIQQGDHVLNGTFTLNTGDSALWTIATKTITNDVVLGMPDLSLFLDQVDLAHEMPGGGFDTSKWQLIGPWNDWIYGNGTELLTRWFIRNLTDANHTNILKVRPRYISALTSGASST